MSKVSDNEMVMYKMDVTDHKIDMTKLGPFKDKPVDVMIIRHRELRRGNSALPFWRRIHTDDYIENHNKHLADSEIEDEAPEGTFGRHEVDKHILHIPLKRGKAWVVFKLMDLDRKWMDSDDEHVKSETGGK